MTAKRYMSNKKTSQQTISISPSLKDWIRRYVSVMHKKNPDNENYKSVSAFYCSVMENVLKIFEEGKTLDDFDKLVDKEIDNFYEPLSANVLLPVYESEVSMNKYLIAGFKENMHLFFGMRKVVMSGVDLDDYQTLQTSFNRIKKRYMKAKATKYLNLDLFTEKGKSQPWGILEHVGLYKNLHHANCKMMAEALGIIGFKITDFLYSEEDLYYRMELAITDLYSTPNLALKKRTDLLKQNVEYLINYNRVLDDTANHLWVRMAQDNDVIINFKNEDLRKKWIETIENDLRKFGTKEAFLLKLLKFFDRLHWIRIENENDLSFQINLIKSKNQNDNKFLFDYLSKYSHISEKNGIYYLERLQK